MTKTCIALGLHVTPDQWHPIWNGHFIWQPITSERGIIHFIG